MSKFTRTGAAENCLVALAPSCSAAVVLTLSAIAAQAADIARPVYKGVPAFPVYSWTGLYVGGHLGWANADRSFQPTTVAGIVTVNPGFSQSADGLIGGMQVGFNQQIGNWVWGLEADLSGANLDARTVAVPPVAVPQTYDVSIGWTATLTGRLGYAWDRWLAYGKGGAALLRENYSVTAAGLFFPDLPLLDAKVARLGWTVGAGIENAFADNWSWKVEYNYMRFDGDDSIANVLSGMSNTALASWTDVAIHAVKTGINYKFRNAPAGTIGIYKSAGPTAYDWTGLYLGGHVGWADADRNFVSTVGFFGFPFSPAFEQSSNGFVGGAQIGFNRQAGNWVAGLEADISAGGLKASTTVFDPITATVEQTYSASIDWLATATGRLGYAWDRWMIFGKGGLAMARENYSAAILLVPRVNAQVTRLGWTLGAGIENALLNGWSWKAEYNYAQFDDISAVHVGLLTNSAGIAVQTGLNAHLVKLGVNYKFGDYGKGPVVAKY